MVKFVNAVCAFGLTATLTSSRVGLATNSLTNDDIAIAESDNGLTIDK